MGGTAGVPPVEVGRWSEGAEFRVDGDLLDRLLLIVRSLFVVLCQIQAGDLEAVEQEAGATRVDLVVGDLAEDLAEGELDAAAFAEVGGRGEAEAVGASAAGGVYLGLARAGTAGVAVVKAEVLFAEGGAAAAAAVGEDVTALVTLGFGGFLGLEHDATPPRGTFYVKSSNN